MSLRQSILLLQSVGSGETTPQSSALPSAYPSESEDDDARGERVSKKGPFRFLDLPSELRNKIYGHVFDTAPLVIDLDPTNYRTIFRRFSLFLVSKQVHAEASHYFYSTRTVRLFPTHGGRFFKTKRPLLARLPPSYRSAISTLELRLGPGWTKPPRGWVINEALGLQDCTRVRVVKVVIQIDPSDGMFSGFRAADGFYEQFSKDLLDGVLRDVPSITEVQFDAWRSVRKNGPMMKGLRSVAQARRKMISFGPEAGWKEEEDDQVWTKSLRDALPNVDRFVPVIEPCL